MILHEILKKTLKRNKEEIDREKERRKKRKRERDKKRKRTSFLSMSRELDHLTSYSIFASVCRRLSDTKGCAVSGRANTSPSNPHGGPARGPHLYRQDRGNAFVIGSDVRLEGD